MRAVSIIVPTLNEAENIDLLLKKIFAVEELRQFDLEVVFSDGASTDDTQGCINKWLNNGNVHLVLNESGAGLSAAVMAGARAAKGEFVVVMDADLSHPPEVIPALLEPLLSEECDMVIGSRYIHGGDTPEWPCSRRISSVLATLPARLLTDVKDPLAGFMALRRERIARMNRKVCGFKIGLELLATGDDTMRVREIPIIFRDRCYGSSKMSAKVVIDYFKQLLILAGVDLLPVSLKKVVLVFLAVLFVDCTLMTVLLEFGVVPGWAHWLSFAPASLIGGGMSFSLYCKHVQQTSGRRLVEYGVGFLWVFLLTILLRSGLVAVMQHEARLSTGAVLLTGLFGLAVSYLFNVFYVFSIGRKRIRRELVQRFYGLGAVSFMMLLRLLYLSSVNLLPEEQYVMQNISSGDSIALVFFGPAPVVVGQLGSAIFGDSVFGMRIGVWLLWFVGAICVFSLARSMYDRSVAFMAFLLFTMLPFFVGTGIFVTHDAVLTLFWCWTLYMLYRALVAGIAKAWVWSGIVVGFGMQADGKLVLLLVGALAYSLLSEEGRERFSTPQPYIGLGAMLLTFIPSFLFWRDGGIDPYAGLPWIDSIVGNTLSESSWVIPLLLSPTGLLAGCYILNTLLRNKGDISQKGGWDTRKNRRFVLCMFILPLLVCIIPGLLSTGAVYAGGLVWLALLPGMALTIGNKGPHDNVFKAVLHSLWWPTIGVLMVTYGTALHFAVV